MTPATPGTPTPRQQVRRPAAHRPGGPPRWAALAPVERAAIGLDRVVRSLADPPWPRSRTGPNGDDAASVHPLTGVPLAGDPAAVLVPLFEEGGETRVLLTVRSARLRSHRGEVAFPGGRLDPGEDAVGAALREAEEEVGLAPRSVTVVGHLTAMPTVSSGTFMTPVVGTLEARPAPAPNPGEVDRVFDVALADLVADGVFHEEWWSVPGRPGLGGRPGGEFPVWFFDVAGEVVWGATARILVELVSLVLGLDDPFAL